MEISIIKVNFTDEFVYIRKNILVTMISIDDRSIFLN